MAKDIKADILWRVFLVYLAMVIFGLAIIVKVIVKVNLILVSISVVIVIHVLSFT